MEKPVDTMIYNKWLSVAKNRLIGLYNLTFCTYQVHLKKYCTCKKPSTGNGLYVQFVFYLNISTVKIVSLMWTGETRTKMGL